MKLLAGRDKLAREPLPGRVIYKAVGKDGPVISGKMTVGFAEYSAKSGPMEPHQHAEETVYIVQAQDAYYRYGDSKDLTGERIPLQEGMLIHFDELEWHVFEYDEGGSLTIIFIYGQVDKIRPEEIANQ
ncbi:MAG: hypothetical protein GY801_09935 [bacterium]|nr:hypothetical protein [bacterium]